MSFQPDPALEGASQLPLFAADDATPERRESVYFAIRPPSGVGRQITWLAEERGLPLGMTSVLVPPERLHVSLNSLDVHGAGSERLDRAIAAADAMRAPSFTVAFNRIGSWGRGAGRRPFVLWGDEGIEGVLRLYATIRSHLGGKGVVRRREPQITPHVTLRRDSVVAPERVIEPMSWRVEEFVLLHSVRGEGRHRVLGRWSLGG